MKCGYWKMLTVKKVEDGKVLEAKCKNEFDLVTDLLCLISAMKDNEQLFDAFRKAFYLYAFADGDDEELSDVINQFVS